MEAAGPHFIRRSTAPKTRTLDYRVFREPVREDFRKTCAYCLLEEMWAAGPENFELDHFRPKSVFPQLTMSYYNLYWSCHVCNRQKHDAWPSKEARAQGISFVDLCASSFDEHFVSQKNGKWRGKTLAARYTIDALRLNRPHLVQLRLLLREMDLL
jgi:uncharacterized protein (TIGR02646 family)